MITPEEHGRQIAAELDELLDDGPGIDPSDLLRQRLPFDQGWVDVDYSALAKVGDRVVPKRLNVVLPGAGGQPRVDLVIDCSDGVPRCTDLRLSQTEGGREVRTTDVRSVQLEGWIEAFVSGVAAERVQVSGQGISWDMPTEESLKVALGDIRSARREARRTITDEFLASVAEVYSSQQHGLKAVQAAFGTSKRSAARWVQIARKRGLLRQEGEST